MKRAKKVFDWILNILTLIAAVAILGTVTENYLTPAFWRHTEVATEPTKGTLLKLSNVGSAIDGATVIFALSTNCRYCRESVGLYRRILSGVSRGPMNFIAIFPEPVSESRAYLRSNGLEISDVRQEDFGKLGVHLTPTVLLLDGSGKVKSTWIGKQSPAGEAEILKLFGIGSGGSSNGQTSEAESSHSDADWSEITGTQLRDLWKAGKVVPVIDIRLRSEYRGAHIADSVNIPIDELEYRAPHEVPRWPTVVLYCYYCPNCDAATHPEGVESSCALAASELKDAGYMHIRILKEDLAHLKQAGIAIVSAEKGPAHPLNGGS